MVLRRYVWPGFLAAEPEAAQREVDALGFAAAHAVPVPQLVAADIDGSHVGDEIAAVLTTFAPGVARAVPDLRSLAAVGASIHAVDASTFTHTYYPWYEDTLDAPPIGACDPALWERAIDIWHNGYALPFRHTRLEIRYAERLWPRSCSCSYSCFSGCIPRNLSR